MNVLKTEQKDWKRETKKHPPSKYDQFTCDDIRVRFSFGEKKEFNPLD